MGGKRTRKLHIGLIEVKCKNHHLADQCRIAATENIRVTVFTTPEILQLAKAELKENWQEYEWIIKEEQESIYSFMKRIEAYANDLLDLVLINSVRNWEFMLFRPRCKILGRFYSLNFYFLDTRSFVRYLYHIKNIRNITSLNPLNNAWIGPWIRRIILTRIDGIIVEYPTFAELLSQQYGVRKKIFFLPMSFYEESEGNLTNQSDTCDTCIKFAILGMIQEERRDYDTILDTFERIFSKYEKQVSLSLLGKPIGQYGSRIIAHMKSFAEQGYNVFFSDTFLEPEEFITKLKGSDVVISPIRQTYKSIALEETYSHTKGSGAFADFVRFGKPTIVPGFYNIADEIKGSFIRYHNSNHLYDLLTDLIENPEKLLNWKSRAGEEASIFNLENLRKKFDMTVNEIFSEKKE